LPVFYRRYTRKSRPATRGNSVKNRDNARQNVCFKPALPWREADGRLVHVFAQAQASACARREQTETFNTRAAAKKRSCLAHLNADRTGGGIENKSPPSGIFFARACQTFNLKRHPILIGI
jgi:hypothetical protein